MSIYVFLYSCALSSCVCFSVYLCFCICVFVLPGAHSVSRLKMGRRRAESSKGEYLYISIFLCIVFLCLSFCVFVFMYLCICTAWCTQCELAQESRWAGGGQRVARSKGEQRRTKVNWKLCEASPSDFIHMQFKASRLPFTNIKFIGRVLLPFALQI